MAKTKLPTDEEIAAMTTPYDKGVARGRRLGYAQCDLDQVNIKYITLLVGLLVGSVVTELVHLVLP
jgi:hypothetical protein